MRRGTFLAVTTLAFGLPAGARVLAAEPVVQAKILGVPPAPVLAVPSPSDAQIGALMALVETRMTDLSARIVAEFLSSEQPAVPST